MADDNSPTTTRRATTSERREQALKWRIAGYTFARIGKEMGISAQAAHKLVVKALHEVATRTAEVAEQLSWLSGERT